MQVLRRFVLHTGKTALVVEHDLLMSSCMADRVVVFDGDPGKAAAAAAPVPADGGLADFLGRILGVTFRRDATNGRWGNQVDFIFSYFFIK